jgi:2-phospho-L-lactate guanylyltransferase
MTQNRSPIWAVIPVKDTRQAKQRLAARLSPDARRVLALTMFEDVLTALAAVKELAGIIVVTVDPLVAAMSIRQGAVVTEAGAHEGYTGAVMATARRLGADGHGMLAMPGDIPLVTSDDIRALLCVHREAPSFTIVPARDFQGSNAVLISPADAVPLRFSENSFYPHLAAAEAVGITPKIHRCASIELDIDTPDDLVTFKMACARTHSSVLLSRLACENIDQAKKMRP